MSANEPKQSYRGIRHEFLVAGLTVLCLLPFIGKGFHIDDTVYLWVAQQIRIDPIDFFGFTKVWDFMDKPMHEINMNPPGVSYFIALGSFIFGWGERGLHFYFLFPNVAAALGIYVLARRLTQKPLFAATVSILTPGFLVSGSNVMCEPLMLALYVWSIVLWVRGLEDKNWRWLVAAGFAIGAGILVKYIVVTVVPLLVAYTLLVERKFTRSLAAFLVPLAIVLSYDLLSFILYGNSIVLSVMEYSALNQGRDISERSALTALSTKFIVNAAFTGGACAVALFLIPWLWPARTMLAFAAFYVSLFVFLLTPIASGIVEFAFDPIEATAWHLLQLALWSTAGIHILYLAGHDLYRRRDPDSTLLFLLVAGMFVFSGFVNWTINVRAVLPMLPAVGILLARRLEVEDEIPGVRFPVAWAVIPAGLLALGLLHADYRFAKSEQVATAEIIALLEDETNPVYYYGGWGFAWYMDQAGYEHLKLTPIGELPDPVQRAIRANPETEFSGMFSAKEGEVLVYPRSDNQIGFDEEHTELVFHLEYPQNPFLFTLSTEYGAGFYSGGIGPLPFYVGRTAPREYEAFRFTKNYRGLMGHRPH